MKEKNDWKDWIVPVIVAVCQGVSVVAWVGVMRTITKDLSLAAPYAVFMALGISTLLSLAFTRSARTGTAIQIILKTPGGAIILLAAIVLSGTIWLVQPILTGSGLSQFQALGLTLFAQVPMATSVTIFSSKFLLRVFNGVYYKRAMDAMLREIRAKRLLEHAQLVLQVLRDVQDISKDKPFASQLKELIADVELRIENMQKMIALVCEKNPTYAPAQYHMLLGEVLKEAKVRLSNDAPTIEISKEKMEDPLEFLLREMR